MTVEKQAPRVYAPLRLRQSVLDQADELASEHGLRRAEVLRLAVSAGFSNESLLNTLINRAKERP